MRLAVNRSSSAKVVRLTDVVAWPTEPVIPCCTRSTASRWATTAIISSNTSRWICWWRTASVAAWSRSASRTERCIAFTPRTRCLPPGATGAPTSRARRRTPAPATAPQWSPGPIYPIRILNLYNFTPQVHWSLRQDRIVLTHSFEIFLYNETLRQFGNF